jgi:hypothetical protein
MPISTKHPQYEKFLGQWEKVRIAIAGEEAVKAAGTAFLPQLSGQDSNEYASYKERAMFYGASSRTVQGLTGAIFRKAPEVVFPERHSQILKSIGRNNKTLEDVSKELVSEAVGIGRVGLFVDAPRTEGADPYLVNYSAESIINWWEVEGTPVEIVLFELRETRSDDDHYKTVLAPFWRILRLGFPEEVPSSELESGPVYYQEIWCKVESSKTSEDKEQYILVDRIVPQMRGGRLLRSIPFFPTNASSINLAPEKSPLIDLVSVNFSHYRNSADLEHGRHFTALPTAWVAGFDPNQQLTIGSSRAWVTEQSNARAGFLEFTGAGLGHLQEGMAAKEKLMAILGARMLEELPIGTEAAETVRLRQSGEASTLATISGTCSSSLTSAMKVVGQWIGLSQREVESISVSLNKDFQTATISPNILVGLMQLVQAGLISHETLFYNLKRGELIPDHRTFSDEKVLINKQLAELSARMGEPAMTNGSPEETEEDDG